MIYPGYFLLNGNTNKTSSKTKLQTAIQRYTEKQRVANDVNILALYIFYFLLLTDHDVGMFCSENIDNHLVTKENNLTRTNH